MIETLNEQLEQNIYHGTYLYNAVEILLQNKIQGNTIQVLNGKQIKGISTSRNKQYSIDWMARKDNSIGVIFELDYYKIKNNNKIIPYNWYDGDGQAGETSSDTEFEEFIVGDVDNIRKKINQIFINQSVSSMKDMVTLYKKSLYQFCKEHAEDFDSKFNSLMSEIYGKLYSDTNYLKAEHIGDRKTLWNLQDKAEKEYWETSDKGKILQYILKNSVVI